MTATAPSSSTLKLPECWGHRGASAAYPENTLASFQLAIHDGAEGIESDVHVSLDDVVVMFHDPTLDRTTNGKGKIKETNWFGEGGMEHLKTTKTPVQSIPTFVQTVELLMKVRLVPARKLEREHRSLDTRAHGAAREQARTFNVDVKIFSEPLHLFTLMHEIIAAQPNWQTELAPRILLGLWHPRFLPQAKAILPYCKRSFIGISPSIARSYFWDDCEVFSIHFSALATWEGQRCVIADAQKAGKRIMVWTVNDRAHMLEATRWGVDVILTDKTKMWLDLREELKKDYAQIMSTHSSMFLWTSVRFWSPSLRFWEMVAGYYLQKYANTEDPADDWDEACPSTPSARRIVLGRVRVSHPPCISSSSSSRRATHRKRASALRLSSDSTVTTLPLYTSPPRQRVGDLAEIPFEQPPAYPDSAEEADEDTDPSDSESAAVYIPSPPSSLPVSPRNRARRYQASARSIGHRRLQSIATSQSDPYLDSLLERSVHALEMSNALLQSSMSTQTSLSAVLADDSADRHLEERTQRLASKMKDDKDMQASWMDELDEISRRVEGLVESDGEHGDHASVSSLGAPAPLSQSLPTSSLLEQMESKGRRRTSHEMRRHQPSQSTSSLQLSAHDRSHFIAPAPARSRCTLTPPRARTKSASPPPWAFAWTTVHHAPPSPPRPASSNQTSRKRTKNQSLPRCLRVRRPTSRDE
ncbi:PLC-like phosphodiesterase [Epithele typhae]|uniref:PLC-like phosphodiesterase n=1 Tax=Epithele typhae TaxID=378194 RepID=UPI0020077B3F|nr:PLC-like phosphodiesterase [Epithele typhae]KAH9943176.1 PLC-like phosphodiesterase [Epithele typhae]